MSTSTPSELRAAVADLLAWQHSHRGDDRLPAHEEVALRADLEAFAEGRNWDAKQQGWWAHSVTALVNNALAQPQVATRAGRLGPATQDLAMLLRGTEHAYEEELELDAAIRWWEQARKLDLPCFAQWGEDFGQLWQQLEWTALLQHLTLLGQAGEHELLMAHAIKVCTRYMQLSPLAALLQDMQGGLTETVFTLR